MKAFRSLSVSALIVLGALQVAVAAEIVGLQNIALEADERVWGLEIHLREGRIVAVCIVPEGWKITAENYGEAALYKDGGGQVEGGADFGHDTFTGADLSKHLSALLLLDRSAVHHKSATLTGFLAASGPNGNRKVPLRPQNFSRREAARCPPPPPN